MKPLVLVIGGAGYIGSHMVRTLLEAGYLPVVFDNLSSGHRERIPREVLFIQGDLQDAAEMENLFRQHTFHAVMHFAASSLVAESVKDPLQYYRNNVAAFLNLLHPMGWNQAPKLIFSSTAAVYGEPREIPIPEDSIPAPVNPYGRSKWMMEQILADLAESRPFSYVIFRYFNAAGAHASGETGESHQPETHLIPNLLASALDGKKEFTLFGSDYPTPDGTCIRDYVHVQDLCDAHLLALQYLEDGGKNEIFNLGSERGYSVREVLQSVEKVTERKIPSRTHARRPGDPAVLVADSKKARRILAWKSKENLETIIRSAYQWQQRTGPIQKESEENGVVISSK